MKAKCPTIALDIGIEEDNIVLMRSNKLEYKLIFTLTTKLNFTIVLLKKRAF